MQNGAFRARISQGQGGEGRRAGIAKARLLETIGIGRQVFEARDCALRQRSRDIHGGIVGDFQEDEGSRQGRRTGEG